MTSWWVLRVLESGGPPFLIAHVIWVIASITLHELAHGWAAIKRGDMTPVETGHMTWNPLVHMGPMSLLMFAVTGIAWGLMPVDPSRMRGRYADAAVAFAGPLMNISLAVICIVASAVLIHFAPPSGGSLWKPESTTDSLLLFFAIGCFLNIGLGLFNLLPAPPLDGSHILSNFSPQYRELAQSAGGQFGGMATLIIGFLLIPRLVWDLGPEVWGRGVRALLWLMAPIGGSPVP